MTQHGKDTAPAVAVVEGDCDARSSVLALVPDLLPGASISVTELGQLRSLAETGLSLAIIGVPRAYGASLEAVGQVRRLSPQSVILAVDHVSGPESVALAFAAGADDVISAPVNKSELAARLRARLANRARTLSDERLADLSTHAKLTPSETRVLGYLLDNRGRIVTREELAREVDQAAWEYGDRKYDVYIYNIRKKLAPHYGGKYHVKTIRSAGYLLY